MSLKDSTITQFSPPGNLPDLTPDNRTLWSKNFISQWMSDEIAGNVTDPYGQPRTPLAQFFNPQFTSYDVGQAPARIQWTAFPHKACMSQTACADCGASIDHCFQVTVAFGNDNALRWHIADSSRAFQDEYLEWSLNREDNGNISSVTFTCEGPEYWQFQMAVQQADGIAKIRSLNGSLIDAANDSDFFLAPYNDPNSRSKWVYNPRGDFNFRTDTGTIAHLIHPSNSLSAEIDIAAQATVIRKDPTGKVIEDSDRLIRCSQYGNPDRNSDPRIGALVNVNARNGRDVSIVDPVALYMNVFDTSNFQLEVSGTQSGAQTKMKPVPHSWYEFQRGDITLLQGLRLRIQNNSGAKTTEGSRLLTVSDIYDGKTSEYIQYGAQFTDYITMGVAGVVKPGQTAEAQPCIHLAADAAGVEKLGVLFVNR